MQLPTVCSFLTLGIAVAALPATTHSSLVDLVRRQNIDFDLVNNTPDPVIGPNDTTDYDQTTAIAAVKNEILEDPLPQEPVTPVNRRDVLVSNSAGYTLNEQLTGATINAPLNCNGADTFMGAKLFANGPFDTALCATACSAQSAYNVAHPPSKGAAKTCQFYNTYALYKNDVYQGQYCSMYTQAWSVSYATNKGQWRGKDHYTIDQSYIAMNSTNSGDVGCPSDIAYLEASGVEFCTAYVSYVPPKLTATVTETPAISVVTSTISEYATTTSFIMTTRTNQYTTTVLANHKRAIQMPASVSSWSPSRISAACSAIATGVQTVTTTKTAAILYSTVATTEVQTKTITVPTTLVDSATSTVTNVVQDPGFELSVKTTPWDQNYGAVRETQPFDATTGTSHMVLSSGRTLGKISQTITGLSTSSNYTLQFSYRQIWGAGCALNAYMGQVTVFSVFSTPEMNSEVYITGAASGILPDSSETPLVFAYVCISSGVVWLDNISLTLSQV